MNVKLLAEHHLEFLSLKGGCTGSSKSTLVKMYSTYSVFSVLNTFQASIVLRSKDGKQNTP